MTPPPLARALVDRLLAPHLRDAVVGDLDEIFFVEGAAHPRLARLRYWRRALGVVLRLGWRAPRRGSWSAPRTGDQAMKTLWTDIDHGARLFVAQPGYALAAAITLALAIGANVLIFTMANVLVLKPLPIANPDRLAWIFGGGPHVPSWRGPITLPEYAAYRDRVPAIDGLSGWQRRTFTLREDGQAERVLGHAVIGDLHGLWGLHAIRGRTLARADEAPAAARSVVLSHRFWATRFGAREDAVGREVRIDGDARVIVGVLAPDIELGTFAEVDVWLPYQSDPMLASTTDRTWRAVGALARGATHETAHAQVAAVAAALAAEDPEGRPGYTGRVGSTRDALGAPNTWVILSLLVTVVGLLLLLACANITNLLIARLIGRQAELAVRTALGATRGRIVRQIVSESLVLGVVGGALGLGLAWAGLAAVRALAAEPFFRQLAIDWRVLVFAAILALLAPLLFSIPPALRMLRTDVRAALDDASARSVSSRRTGRAQSALVVLQVTMAITLLIVAGLVVQSMQTVSRVDVGYDVASVLSTHIEIPAWKVPDDGEAARVRTLIVERAAAIAGVAAAAVVSEIPALQPLTPATFAIGATESDDPASRPTAALSVASPSYFDVTRTPIVAGRGFVAGDAASAAPVVVISREAARRYFGDAGRALGAQLVIEPRAAAPPAPATVVGVAADVDNAGPGMLPSPQIYMLDAHRTIRSFYLLLRGERPEVFAEALRVAIRDVDPDLPTYQLRTLRDAFAEENSSNRLLIGLFAAFAVVAVLLATAGLYGMMSYAVGQRRREIALRMALGASRREVAARVVGRSLYLAGVGGALGMGAAFLLAQAIRSVLFGVGPGDPATYLSAIAVTTAAAVCAAWLPTRWAVAVDPAMGLRHI